MKLDTSCDSFRGQDRTPLQIHEFPLSVMFSQMASIRGIIQRRTEFQGSTYAVVMGTVVVICRELLCPDFGMLELSSLGLFSVDYLVKAVCNETEIWDEVFVRTVLYELDSTGLIKINGRQVYPDYLLNLCDLPTMSEVYYDESAAQDNTENQSEEESTPDLPFLEEV